MYRFFSSLDLLFLYVMFLLFVLLMPSVSFDRVKTQVKWLNFSGGIEIISSAVIRSTQPPLKFHNAMIEGGGITIDIRLTSNKIHQTGPARIISYSYGNNLRNFTLGQQGKDLIFRLRTSSSNFNGLPNIVAKNVFSELKSLRITITYDFSEYRIYMNGNLLLSGKRIGDFSSWDSSYFFMLANEFSSDRAWLGKIHKIAIYNQPVNQKMVHDIDNLANKKNFARKGLVSLYLFNEGAGSIIHDTSKLKSTGDLDIQKTIYYGLIPQYNFLSPLVFNNFKDIFINILLFVPLGLLCYVNISKFKISILRSFVFVFISGVLFSLMIELLQVFLVTRHSSLTDVLTNSLGMIIGILAALKINNKVLMKETYTQKP